MNKKILIKRLIIFTAILIISVFLGQKYRTDNTQLKVENFDLNGNSIPETYTLKNGKLSIEENSKIIWQSERNWRVDDFILKDVTNDGTVDINLSVWKAGNFGKYRPF